MVEYKVIIHYFDSDGVKRVKNLSFSSFPCAKGCLLTEKDILGGKYCFGEIIKVSESAIYTTDKTYNVYIRCDNGVEHRHSFKSIDDVFSFVKSVDDFIECKIHG